MQVWNESNLVDPASSHMLVSKIKPCMSKYKFLYIQRNCEWLIKTVIVYLIFKLIFYIRITVVILGANTCEYDLTFRKGRAFIRLLQPASLFYRITG